MKLFGGKQPQSSVQDDAARASQQVFDDQFREELRELGRTHLKGLIDQNAEVLRQDIDTTVNQVAEDLRQYMTTQLDGMIAGVNTEITKQLQERISEYNRLATEAQNQAGRSLTQNSQTIYEKYQQLSAALQQAVSNQEILMVTTFQDNKNRIALIEQEQYKALSAIQEAGEASRRESEDIHRMMARTVRDQSVKLDEVYQENLSRVKGASEAHETTLQTLQESARALQARQQQLGEFLDNMVSEQRSMLAGAVHDNMARIIEHYLVEALGEQSDVRSQLPSILQKMEENKQAMLDDMTL